MLAIRLAFLLALMGASSSPADAWGQAPVTEQKKTPAPAVGTPAAAHLAVLTVDLWADYDRPSMLVMFECELPPGTQLPATFSVRIPAAAGEPHAVARRGAKRQLYMAKYTRQVEGQWARIQLTTDRRTFRIEYYAPLVVKESARRFRFQWPNAPKVDLLRYTIQMPLAAKDFKTVPAATKLWRDRQGMLYRLLAAGQHEAGKTIQLDLSYESATGELSAHLIKGRSVAPPPKMAPSTGGIKVAATRASKDEEDGFQKWVLYGLLLAAGVFVGLMARAGKGRKRR